MLTIKKIFYLISILIIYEIIKYIIGARYINWSEYYESDIDSFFRNAYLFLEAFDSFIISFLIVKFSEDETYKSYINRIKLIIIITLTKFSMIVILNTINPTNRIISDKEWENNFFQNLVMVIIQILLGLIIFYFIKPKTRNQKKIINVT